MVRALVLCFVVFMAGCVGSTYGETRQIEPAYAPLETLSERPNAVLSATAITTVGPVAYVVDLDDFLARRPPGSARYHAVMLHEQEHAKRQVRAGVYAWLAAYLTDPAVMWAEEQRGYYYEIITFRNNGVVIDVSGIARTLHNYKTATGQRMVTQDDARAWIEAVLAGTWTPPD